MAYGLSRDDAGKILADYTEKNIFEADPTERLDRVGVGELMKIAVERGRSIKPLASRNFSSINVSHLSACLRRNNIIDRIMY